MIAVKILLGFVIGLLAASLASADDEQPEETPGEDEGSGEDEGVSEYLVNLVETEDIPAPDSLVAGEYAADTIKLAVEGEYKRGTLLMTGEDGFINATSAGISSAGEVCILCDDVEVQEDSYIMTAGYFRGTFSKNSIIIPYEEDTDNHAELIESITGILRKQGIFVV